MTDEESAFAAELAELAASEARARARHAAERAAREAELQPTDVETDEEPREPIPSNLETLNSILELGDGDYDFAASLARFQEQHDAHVAACKETFCGQCARHCCTACGVVPVADYDRRCNPCALLAAIPRTEMPARFADAHLHLRERVYSAAARKLAGKSLDAPNIVFTGRAGLGKTVLACGMGIALLERAITRGARVPKVLFVAALELGRARSTHRLGEDEPQIVVDAIGAELLIVDDFGAEAPRESEAVVQVLHERHNANAKTWITTGLSMAEVGARYGGGVERRIFEGAVRIDCGAKK